MLVAQANQFKVRPGSFREIRKKYLLRVLPLMLLAMSTGITIAYVKTAQDGDDFVVLPLVIVFFLIYLTLSTYRSLKRNKALFESFTLTIDATLIIREQLHMQPIYLYHREVTHIGRLKNGALLIKSKDAANTILVPAQIENKREVEWLLNAIQPINDTPKLSLAQRYPLPFILLMLATMGLVFISTNKLVVGIGGAVLLAFFGWAIYKGSKSKNIDHGTKNRVWIVLLVMISVLIRAVLILKSHQ